MWFSVVFVLSKFVNICIKGASHTQTVSELLIDLCCVWDYLYKVLCSEL